MFDFPLSSLVGFALSSLAGLSWPSLGFSLPSLDGLLTPLLDGFALSSLDGLSWPSLGFSLQSLDGLLAPSLDGFFPIFTIFFEGGEAVPAGVVRPTLTPGELQDFSGGGTGQVSYHVFTRFTPEAHSPQV